MTPNTVLACLVLLILAFSALLAWAWCHDRKKKRQQWESHKQFMNNFREYQE